MVEKVNLSVAKLKALEPAPLGSRRMIWDGVLPNFGVRIGDKPGEKVGGKVRAAQISFVVMRRVGGKLIRYKIGEFDRDAKDESEAPEDLSKPFDQNARVGLGRARERARAIIADMGRGVHPKDKQEERRQEAEREARVAARARENTFVAAAERFIKEHVAGLRTAKDTESIIRRELVSRWGERPIAEVTRADVSQMVSEIVGLGKKAAARKALAYCRSLFNWCLESEEFGLETSPCVKALAKKKLGKAPRRQRVLSDDELRALWRATEWALGTGHGVGYPFAPYSHMLLVTGQRLREVSNMTWGEVDFTRELWTIPAARMKGNAAHEVPLSPLALKILKALPRGAAGDFVFSTTSGARPISGFSKSKDRIDAAILDIMRKAAAERGEDPGKVKAPENWTFHDLRRTMRTRLGGLPIGSNIAELVIAHAQPQLHKVYDLHKYQKEKLHALNLWADTLLSIVAPHAGNVVELSKARG